MDEPVEKSGKRLKDLHTKAMEDWETAEELWRDNVKAFLEDTKFRAGHQWPEEVKNLRGDDRPMLVVDKLGQFVRQVVNDGRMNRPAINITPDYDGAVEEVASAFKGIIRHIAQKSNADIAYDSALEPAVVGGFGFIRVMTDYVSRNSFNQELKITRVANPLSIRLGPYHQADGSDTKFAFVIDEIPKEEFKKRYPKAEETNFESGDKSGWQSDKTVRIAEYFYMVDEEEPVHLLADGTTVTDEDYQGAISNGIETPAIVETRNLPTTQVKWCRLNGKQILEENEWLGKYIPIAIVVGNEFNIDGKVIYSGLIRSAKDPQRLYNYARSAYAERVALTPKAPFIAAVGQVEDRPEWLDANTQNYSVLTYDPIEVNGQMVAPPQRQSPSDIPEGFARDMQLSEHDIQAATGMYSASLGAQSNEKSGKAILARQREGDTGTFHYVDNLNRAIRHIGVILVDLIPKIYDSKRAIRILGEDGDSESAEHDPDQDQAVVRMGSKAIYNLSVGQYGVTISTGPSFTTKRLEAAEAMIEITRANPQAWNTHGDLIAKAQDWPGHEEWAERSKLVMPPELQQAIQKDKSLSPDAQQIKAQAEMAIKQFQDQIQGMEQAMQEAQQKVQGMELAMKDKQAKEQSDLMNAETNQFKAETERMVAASNASAQPPQDNSDAEMVKLQYEDKWKMVDAGVKLAVAEISAASSAGQAEGDSQASSSLQAVLAAVNENMTQLMSGNQMIADGISQGLSHVAMANRLPRIASRDAQGNLVSRVVE